MTPTRRLAIVLAMAIVGAPWCDAFGQPCTGTTTVPALVTVRTAGPEAFVVRVVDQAVLDGMIDICLGVSADKIVIGALRTGNAGYNRDPLNGSTWSWHLDENSIVLAEVAIELCDGLPSFVESNLQTWVETVGDFCPWSSQIIAIQPDVAIPGDFDVDGDVDSDDFTVLEGCFTPHGSQCYDAGPGCCAADVDGDGDVDCADWTQFAANWTGLGEPPALPQCVAAVPSASGWGSLAVAMLVLGAGVLALATRRIAPE